MHYFKYFKNGQKVLLRSLDSEDRVDRFDTIITYFEDYAPDYFDLNLPHGDSTDESYPFSLDMPLEILSEAFGLGLRLTGIFKGREGNRIRLDINRDLEVFQRRLRRRINTKVGLSYTKGTGRFKPFREQWEKNVKILGSGVDSDKMPAFPTKEINLSSTGIRLEVKAPICLADHCLFLIALEDEGPPICALAEVVWVNESEETDRWLTGMQFISILESDQARIETFVKSRPEEEWDENLPQDPTF